MGSNGYPALPSTPEEIPFWAASQMERSRYVPACEGAFDLGKLSKRAPYGNEKLSTSKSGPVSV